MQYFKTIFLISLLISCVNKKTNLDEISSKKIQNNIVVQKNKIDSNQTLKLEINDSNYFNFKNYSQYDLSDTIKVDINGNGILNEIYFIKQDSCTELKIEENQKQLISIGCNSNDLNYPDSVDWVDIWCLVKDKKVHKVLFLENGDIDKDTIIKLERPCIYIGKREVGGGIITYKKNKFEWVHQSD